MEYCSFQKAVCEINQPQSLNNSQHLWTEQQLNLMKVLSENSGVVSKGFQNNNLSEVSWTRKVLASRQKGPGVVVRGKKQENKSVWWKILLQLKSTSGHPTNVKTRQVEA